MLADELRRFPNVGGTAFVVREQFEEHSREPWIQGSLSHKTRNDSIPRHHLDGPSVGVSCRLLLIGVQYLRHDGRSVTRRDVPQVASKVQQGLHDTGVRGLRSTVAELVSRHDDDSCAAQVEAGEIRENGGCTTTQEDLLAPR